MSYKFVLSLIVGLFLIGGVFAQVGIGYVVDDSSNLAEDKAINVIKELGYTKISKIIKGDDYTNNYHIIDDSEISSVDFFEYGVIIIGGGINNKDLILIPYDGLNVIFFDRAIAKEVWGLSGSDTGKTTKLEVKITDFDSVILEGVDRNSAGEIRVYTSSKEMHYLNSKPGYVDNAVVAPGSSNWRDGVISTSESMNLKKIFFGLPETDYWTTETRDMFSNSINWLMENGNHAPVLDLDIEDLEWYAGESVSINLDDYFSDEDGDDLIYTVEDTSPDKTITVTIVDNIITFESLVVVDEDWVRFRAEDDSEASVLSNEISLSVVEDTREELSITSYSPNLDSVKILDGDVQDFSVDVSEEDVEVNWFIDNSPVGFFSLSYLFIEGIGDYNLKAVVNKQGFSDVEKVWDVEVGVISDFTCSEIGGDVCTSEEICSEDFLGVSDSFLCCSVSCSEKPLEFNDIDRENVTGDIELEIKDPEENEESILGETIRLKLDIDNNVDDDLDIDVKVYLYDLTEDEVVENYDYTTEVNEDSSRIFNVDLEIPYDINEDNNYALFVQINDEDEEYFNEDYVKINLEREEYKIVIDKINFIEQVDCGDYFNVEVKLKNIGSEDVGVYFKIENSVLKINEKTEEFELEAYDGKDSITRTFSLKIPEGVEKEIYGIKVSAYFGGKKAIETKSVVIDCVGSEMNVDSIGVVSLGGESSNASVSKGGKGAIIFGFVLMFVLVLGLVGSFVYIGLRE